MIQYISYKYEEDYPDNIQGLFKDPLVINFTNGIYKDPNANLYIGSIEVANQDDLDSILLKYPRITLMDYDEAIKIIMPSQIYNLDSTSFIM